MIKKMYIDNFKALNDFTIEFSNMNVLIGKNGVGKSSVLQALDFIKNFAIKDLDVYMSDRNWKASEIGSKLTSTKHITFKIHYATKNNDVLIWSFTVNPVKKTQLIEFIREELTRESDQKVLLAYSSNGGRRFNNEINDYEAIPSLNLNSSLLKTIDPKINKNQYPELVELKEYFLESDSFELMSTEKMRKNSRGNTDSIGAGGEKLSAFIHNMDSISKKDFLRLLSNYLKSTSDINTYVKGTPGWVYMDIQEKYKDKIVDIDMAQISDGTLRLIGFAAIAEINKSLGFVLLDEIEDGINTAIAANLVKELEKLSKTTSRQFFVTTHSTVMLDYFNEDNIIFLWRTSDGNVKNRRLIKSDKIKLLLNEMYVGELLYNLDEEKLISYLESVDDNEKITN
ncbi:Predicted ATPase [Dethiosulfatibacter aminovorans DSM 17477]|uniref:Predicted ATPase n=1 Tax=Dethiosulfatibacter aminovorans DSM 17477 TaxID=1121476 RepID=A0A1M6LU62_9FIRM|nr:ATP-binding protein [Dethiosulfatibacter aminovorans]SHJ74797.1 Predicted ATPase [Dethiosulfatibacter aminovorans DSM 17477]